MNRRQFVIKAGAVSTLAPACLALKSLPAIAAQDVPPALSSLFGGPFSLIDHNGLPRTDKDFRGRYMLIFFGYTFCPSICPTNLQQCADAIEMLGEKGKKIVPIFISIDPERDTPAVLKEYVANFSDRFVGLTGSEKQITVVSKAYRIHRRKVLPDGETDKNNYLVDHSSITYLMGPDGKFVTLFPHNTSGEKMTSAISRYL